MTIMKNAFDRAKSLYQEDGMTKLANAKIAVLGLGGVGSAVVEALARSGIGNFLLIDNDTVDITNINRQLIANIQNVGNLKTDETKKRILSINNQANIQISNEFFLPDNSDFLFDFSPDYIIDAIDTVTSKIFLAQKSREFHIPLISSLGTGNRIDPSKLKFGDISETSGCGCPLARVMRRELKKRQIPNLDVVFSTELPFNIIVSSENGRHSPASSAFVPNSAGFLIASIVVKNILEL